MAHLPDDVRATIVEALDDSKLYTLSLERVSDAEKAEWVAKCDAALEALQPAEPPATPDDEYDHEAERELHASYSHLAPDDDVIANAYDLLEVVKLTYRKHHADDDAIGWDELSDKLADVLSNAMGVENFAMWQESNYVDAAPTPDAAQDSEVG